MSIVRPFMLLVLLTLSVPALLAQSDLGVTATDSPDPVAPDGNITYAITVTNGGPSAAVNARMSVILNGSLLFRSITTPAGWTCAAPAVGGGASFTCTAATLSVSSSVFSLVLNAGRNQFGINDSTINQVFTVNSDLSDPNSANNTIQVSTAYVTPKADVSVTATDSPDPVAPNGNITYAITVTNGGPDSAVNTRFNVVLNGTLLFRSITVPAGWTCATPAVGGGASFTCTAANLPLGASQFSLVLNAGRNQFGINDGTINQVFGVNSDLADTDNANNTIQVSTAYVTPKADVSVTATDSPDPVAPDGNITYAITVTNGGPDSAVNTRFNVVLNGTLLFRSITVPSGWTCATPAVGGGASFTCTAANLPLGASQFSLVLNAGRNQFGINDGTINQVFGVNSDLADTNNANNTIQVSTAYVTPKADVSVTATDSPDPVAPDGNITYAITVTNSGPDPAVNARLNVPLNNTLLFRSITVPAGWTCATPAVGGGASFTCTAANLPLGASQFSLVLNAGRNQFGINDATINQVFSVNSDLADTNNANNTIQVTTAYVTPDADMRITATDSPDPVASDADITYSLVVTNGGPDTAPNVTLTVPLNNTLLFQSITRPAGWSCATPAVNGGTSFSCTATNVAVGSYNFTLVLRAPRSRFGATMQTINQNFSVTSDLSDPVGTNNLVTVPTTYRPAGFDPDGNGTVSVADVFYLISTLFQSGPGPIGSGDADGDGAVSVADVFYAIAFLFQNGPVPR